MKPVDFFGILSCVYIAPHINPGLSIVMGVVFGVIGIVDAFIERHRG